MSDALIRRVEAAIYSTTVNRFAIEEEWPECHRKNCPHRHPDPSGAMTTIQIQIAETVKKELGWRSTTRPDVAEPDDSPEDAAVYTLATLLDTYNVHHAGTFVKAARLIVEAYPALIPALTPTSESQMNRSKP